MITLRRLGLHVGRRGVFLILFGVVYLLIGYSYLGEQVNPAARHALRLALRLAPLTVYAWAWITAGTVAVLCGALCGGRKTVGFTAAVVMPVIWACVYFAAWLNGDLPRGWVTAALFTLIGGAVAVVAGMPEPRDLLKGRR